MAFDDTDDKLELHTCECSVVRRASVVVIDFGSREAKHNQNSNRDVEIGLDAGAS